VGERPSWSGIGKRGGFHYAAKRRRRVGGIAMQCFYEYIPQGKNDQKIIFWKFILRCLLTLRVPVLQHDPVKSCLT